MAAPVTDEALWPRLHKSLGELFTGETYDMWFRNLECGHCALDSIELLATNEFNAIWIENNYLPIIAQQATLLIGRTVTVKIGVRAAPKEEEEKTPAVALPDRRERESRVRESAAPAQRPSINIRNNFESFIVGTNNQLAHAACIAVANEPGRAYNPLFVFGETGLGKTHLMHAVAHQMWARNPSAKIAYVSTEKFTNEFIQAIRENKLTAFRRFYRNVDVLLVDDVHFLSGKVSTQEEFFHTFNELFESGKQIFLASDRPANEIASLESRLISRFQWGLVTDIQPPDFETRVAILRKKSETLAINLTDEILMFLAERVSRNVRRMEGALTRISSYQSLIHRPVTVAVVEGLISDLLHEESARQLTLEEIQKKVADYYKVRLSDLTGRRRTAQIVLPRHIAMHICRTLTGVPLKQIGDAFGGRDHGTVINACRVVENMMEQDPSVKRSVEYLSRQLSQSIQ